MNAKAGAQPPERVNPQEMPVKISPGRPEAGIFKNAAQGRSPYSSNRPAPSRFVLQPLYALTKWCDPRSPAMLQNCQEKSGWGKKRVNPFFRKPVSRI